MIIICSEEEKKTFIFQATQRNFCPFLYCSGDCISDCKECISQNVRFVTEKREADDE